MGTFYLCRINFDGKIAVVREYFKKWYSLYTCVLYRAISLRRAKIILTGPFHFAHNGQPYRSFMSDFTCSREREYISAMSQILKIKLLKELLRSMH